MSFGIAGIENQFKKPKSVMKKSVFLLVVVVAIIIIVLDSKMKSFSK